MISPVDLLVLVFITVPFLLLYFLHKKETKEWEQRRLKDKTWLDEEMAKPMYFVEFQLLSGEIKKTSKYRPWQTCAGGNWNIKRTSEGSANSSLERDYERGYFTDEYGVTYPACNVKSAVVKVEQ